MFRHLPFFGSFGISKSTPCKLILQTKWPHETSYKNEAYIVTLGAPLNGSSFKRVYCTHFFVILVMCLCVNLFGFHILKISQYFDRFIDSEILLS